MYDDDSIKPLEESLSFSLRCMYTQLPADQTQMYKDLILNRSDVVPFAVSICQTMMYNDHKDT